MRAMLRTGWRYAVSLRRRRPITRAMARATSGAPRRCSHLATTVGTPRSESIRSGAGSMRCAPGSIGSCHGASGVARYFVPLAIAFEERDEERTRQLGAAAVAKVRQQASVGLLADAMADEAFCRTVVRAIGAARAVKTEGGSMRFTPGATFGAVVGDAVDNPTPLHRLTASSNSVSLLGDRLFLKAYRRLQSGESPELEMGRFLTDVAHFAHCVPVAGSVEFVDSGGSVTTLALLQAQVTNQGDAWAFVVDEVARMRCFAGAISSKGGRSSGPTCAT